MGYTHTKRQRKIRLVSLTHHMLCVTKAIRTRDKSDANITYG